MTLQSELRLSKTNARLDRSRRNRKHASRRVCHAQNTTEKKIIKISSCNKIPHNAENWKIPSNCANILFSLHPLLYSFAVWRRPRGYATCDDEALQKNMWKISLSLIPSLWWWVVAFYTFSHIAEIGNIRRGWRDETALQTANVFLWFCVRLLLPTLRVPELQLCVSSLVGRLLLLAKHKQEKWCFFFCSTTTMEMGDIQTHKSKLMYYPAWFDGSSVFFFLFHPRNLKPLRFYDARRNRAVAVSRNFFVLNW